MAVTAHLRDSAKIREGISLIGSYDGVNLTFMTPDKFVQTTKIRIKVYLNGQRLNVGAMNDYTIVESGGPGTGYDTIVVAVAPKSYENLIADYQVP